MNQPQHKPVTALSSILQIINNPYGLVLLIGLGIYFLSTLSTEQIKSLEMGLALLNTPIGIIIIVVILGVGVFAMHYQLIFYRAGNFLAHFLEEWQKGQHQHYRETRDMHQTSKRLISEIHDVGVKMEKHTAQITAVASEVQELIKFFNMGSKKTDE